MTIRCRYRSALALLIRKSLPGTTACILKDSSAWKNIKCSEMVRKHAIPKVRKTTVYDHYNFIAVIYTILCQMTSITSYVCKRLIPWCVTCKTSRLQHSPLKFLFQTQLIRAWPTALLTKLLTLQAFQVCMDEILAWSAGELQYYSFGADMEENSHLS